MGFVAKPSATRKRIQNSDNMITYRQVVVVVVVMMMIMTDGGGCDDDSDR